MFRNNKNTFFCFSPPVMIVTFIIEIGLLLYTVWRYKFNRLTQLVMALLFFLAMFQLAEFQVCEGSSAQALWAQIGYVSITLLPPLGIHIMHLLSKQKSMIIVYAAYATAAAFVAYFALSAGSLNGHECLGNYVIFQVNQDMTVPYGIYYYGWVITAMVLSFKFATEAKTKRLRQALYGFAFGYAAFLIPTTTANLLDKATTRGIPSIMCGFAVLMALVAVLYVMPRVAIVRPRKHRR